MFVEDRRDGVWGVDQLRSAKARSSDGRGRFDSVELAQLRCRIIAADDSNDHDKTCDSDAEERG